MMRFGQSGFFSGGGRVRLVSQFQPPAIHRQMAQAVPPESLKVTEARRNRDRALKNLRSVEDNLEMLDETMGPEAALQALDEGRASLERAEQELQDVLSEEGLSAR